MNPELSEQVQAVIEENPRIVRFIEEEHRMGYIGYLVAQVMKKTKGKADPQAVADALSTRFPAPQEQRMFYGDRRP